MVTYIGCLRVRYRLCSLVVCRNNVGLTARLNPTELAILMARGCVLRLWKCRVLVLARIVNRSTLVSTGVASPRKWLQFPVECLDNCVPVSVIGTLCPVYRRTRPGYSLALTTMVSPGRI